MSKKQTESVGIRLSAFQRTRIDHEAAKLGKTRTEFIRFIIDGYFKNKDSNDTEQDQKDAKLARLTEGILQLSKAFSEGSTDILTAIESQSEHITKIHSAMPQMFGNFKKIAQAIIVSNPQAENEFKNIFTDSSLMEGK